MCGSETDIVASNIKGALIIDCRHDQGFERSHQVKSGHSLPEGIFPNVQVCLRYLDFPIYCALGDTMGPIIKWFVEGNLARKL